MEINKYFFSTTIILTRRSQGKQNRHRSKKQKGSKNSKDRERKLKHINYISQQYSALNYALEALNK